jgi:hypothetical protein
MPNPEDGLRGEAKLNKNLANFNWTCRVNSENKVCTKGGTEYRVAKDMCRKNLVCDKVNNHNPVFKDAEPDERTLRKIMEMSKNECETSNFNLRTTEKVPRERFLLPQSTNHDLGWGASVYAVGQPSITGMHNYRAGKFPVVKNAGPEPDGRLEQYPHNWGSYITRVGDPTCVPPARKRKKPKKDKSLRASESAPELGVEKALQAEKDEREILRVQSQEGMDFVPLYTKQLRKANQKVHELLEKQKRNRLGFGAASKWYRGVGQSDITLYANSYTLCCGNGPFSKDQLLFSR